MSNFYTLLTTVGASKLANATALGTTVTLAQLAVGDGNGSAVTPTQSQTALVNQVRIAALNTVNTDDDNPNWIVCEQVIPAEEGGFTIREVGLFDSDGDLIAVGNFPETYKPLLSEGSGRTQTIRIVLEINATESIELKIDPSVVLATREYVDQQDADMLQQAKDYADAQDSDLKAYVDAQDKSYQTAAKSDATKKANQALADAKDYTDDIRAGIFSLLADESSGYLKLNIDDDTTLIIQSVALSTSANGVIDVQLPISFTKEVWGGFAAESFAAGWLNVSPEAGVMWGFDSENSTLSTARVLTRWVTNNSVYVSGASGRVIVWGI